ncbi:MAG: DNA primase regulatory subunit PriL [Methanoregulaceae archaeon]|nr:DNA primase regulatory subunit PriL [Methanoregulaceae archaeon]
MRVALDERDLVKYPFLKESQQFIARQTDALEEFLATEYGKRALSLAVTRLGDAIRQPAPAPGDGLQLPSDRFGVQISIASYALARVIVSCMHDRGMIDRLTRYEAWRSFQFLVDEDPDKKAYVAESLGIDPASRSIPVIAFVEIASGMREDRWRLVNRAVGEGQVQIREGELDELLRERIRVIITRQFPSRVPQGICGLIAPYIAQVTVAFQERMLEQFGVVDETSFPPCMQALIAALGSGTNLPHTGRFALTAFLHNIGMESSGIIELYSSAPDFDIQRTMYQVEHITGRGGTEYTAPSCAAMKTTGLCVRRDQVCERVSHPLNYYRYRKRKKEGSGRFSAEAHPDAAHEQHEPGHRDDIGKPAGHHDGKAGKKDNEDDKSSHTGR